MVGELTQGKGENVSDNAEEVVIKPRTNTVVITEILLRQEQIEPFKEDLEGLCKKYLNME